MMKVQKNMYMYEKIYKPYYDMYNKILRRENFKVDIFIYKRRQFYIRCSTKRYPCIEGRILHDTK